MILIFLWKKTKTKIFYTYFSVWLFWKLPIEYEILYYILASKSFGSNITSEYNY